jgi:hypothetical protein
LKTFITIVAARSALFCSAARTGGHTGRAAQRNVTRAEHPLIGGRARILAQVHGGAKKWRELFTKLTAQFSPSIPKAHNRPNEYC